MYIVFYKVLLWNVLRNFSINALQITLLGFYTFHLHNTVYSHRYTVKSQESECKFVFATNDSFSIFRICANSMQTEKFDAKIKAKMGSGTLGSQPGGVKLILE